MRILTAINSLSSGGAEVFVAALLVALKDLGCDVELFTYCGAIDERGQHLDAELAQAGVKHHSPKIRRNMLKVAVPYYLSRRISEFKPDICHSHLEQSDFFLWMAGALSLAEIIKVRTIHNVYASTALPKFVHRRLCASYRANIACGPAVLSQYPYLRGTDGVINNGIDLSCLAVRADRGAIRTALSVAAEDKLFVHIGAFSLRDHKLQKAQDVIVQALALTKAANVVVAFLGSGEQRSLVERMAREFGVASRCRFVGRVTQPADYMGASDGVLMPSRFEGLSIGCIEAVCAGLPLIASNIEAFAPFKKASTLFVDPDNVTQLAEAIDLFVSNNDGFKVAAVHHQSDYRNEFDIRIVASRYLQCYKNLKNNQSYA